MTQRTDKELLELAARAAGIECDEVGPFIEFKEWQSEFGMNLGGSFELVRRNWEPLSDDGDAFRLAVKLGLLSKADVLWAANDASCPYAATRRAIVRVAAEIGAKL